MKKLVGFSIICLFFLLIFSCSVQEDISDKALCIVSFGIETKEGEVLKPGQNIVLFAKANRTKDVSYCWDLAGVVLENVGDRVEWTIPATVGEYPIKVTAKNNINNESIIY